MSAHDILIQKRMNLPSLFAMPSVAGAPLLWLVSFSRRASEGSPRRKGYIGIVDLWSDALIPVVSGIKRWSSVAQPIESDLSRFGVAIRVGELLIQ
jgi:hypothetical protein